MLISRGRTASQGSEHCTASHESSCRPNIAFVDCASYNSFKASERMNGRSWMLQPVTPVHVIVETGHVAQDVSLLGLSEDRRGQMGQGRLPNRDC